jgi:GT2 family glycosyltransferase
MHNDSTSKGINKKPYASFSAQRAIKEHLTRTGVSASVEILPNQMYRVKYSLPSKPPLVSIIIPTKNNKEILHKCIKSITSKTIYSNYEIIVVNNNSDESQTLNYFEELKKESNIEVIKDKRDFNFSAINNTAVEHAKGSYICFLNDDTEVITSDWLSEMVSIAVQPNVGAVGAKLWYPNQTLQHGGVILGIAGIGSHSHKHLSKGYDGYFNRAGLIQNFSAITAACMLLSKKLFQKVGGFDEENLSVAYNDLDLCLKIQELNYRIVWTPFAELYHHESMSRGEDTNTENRKRLTKESNYMLKKWGDKIKNDPAYSPNLTLDIESYELAWPPRIENHITD